MIEASNWRDNSCVFLYTNPDEACVKCTSTLYKDINVSLSCLKILQLIHSEITFSYACVGLVTQSSCDMLIYAQSSNCALLVYIRNSWVFSGYGMLNALSLHLMLCTATIYLASFLQDLGLQISSCHFDCYWFFFNWLPILFADVWLSCS